MKTTLNRTIPNEISPMEREQIILLIREIEQQGGEILLSSIKQAFLTIPMVEYMTAIGYIFTELNPEQLRIEEPNHE